MFDVQACLGWWFPDSWEEYVSRWFGSVFPKTLMMTGNPSIVAQGWTHRLYVPSKRSVNAVAQSPIASPSFDLEHLRTNWMVVGIARPELHESLGWLSLHPFLVSLQLIPERQEPMQRNASQISNDFAFLKAGLWRIWNDSGFRETTQRRPVAVTSPQVNWLPQKW